MRQSRGRDVKGVIGLMPAAGYGSRFPDDSGSKEVFDLSKLDLPFGELKSRPLVCSDYLENLRSAGVEEVLVLIRREKLDVANTLGSGHSWSLNLCYKVLDQTPGLPYTVDAAYSFVKDRTVLFGFPDVLIRPRTTLSELLRRHVDNDSTVTLAVFPTDMSRQSDMVEVDRSNQVQAIHVKPRATTLSNAWIAAAWGDEFSSFLNDYLHTNAGQMRSAQSEELHLGDVFQAAIENGHPIQALEFDGRFIDLGSSVGIRRLRSEFAYWYEGGSFSSDSTQST